ncbi:hypothetical protein F3Y22_tig00112349pilonHSYRG00001 [Hibiscus syriacus]|uniref:Kinesin motor domain-containing protein n=1 Tax=Hibiscus syriacus TaxID=106335 RepID=A0A6A2XZB5_HIBSY|nr:hypothetical protein F3Y22_tig00112349pilonHSYRG00001 [Hibiscus syriacus]
MIQRNHFIGTADHDSWGFIFATKGTDTAVARKLSMEMNEKKESRVFVRLRPMSKKEKEAGSRHFTFDASLPDSIPNMKCIPPRFKYEYVFGIGTFSLLEGSYSLSMTAELVEEVLQGRNGSVFCYGATGAGKTYTMLGTVDNPSFVGIAAAGFTQYRAYSTDEVMALLRRGNQNRITEPTRANETSSRSHAILQVVVEYRVKDASMNVINKVGSSHSSILLVGLVTLMSTNISPSNVSFGETQNTIHWADRARKSEPRHVRPMRKYLHHLKQVQPINPSLPTFHTNAYFTLVSNNASINIPTNNENEAQTTILSRNCATPESSKRDAEEAVNELKLRVKALESEMARMKKDHALELKQKKI